MSITGMDLVIEVFMILTVAQQVTRAGTVSAVVKPELSTIVRRYDRSIEIYEVRIIGWIPLRCTYAMRVMTNVARRIFALNVFVVLGKTLIVKNAIATVAAIAQRIIGCALGRVVQSLVVTNQNRRKSRTMRAVRAGPARACRVIRVVAINAPNC